jgi:hypothetical protein
MSRFMVAAPSSGAGKTTITLALMRLMQRAQIEFQPAKSGPDYIDPWLSFRSRGHPFGEPRRLGYACGCDPYPGRFRRPSGRGCDGVV